MHQAQTDLVWNVQLAPGARQNLPVALSVQQGAGVTMAGGIVRHAHPAHSSWRETQLASHAPTGIGALKLLTAVLHLARALGIPSVSSTYMMSLSGIQTVWAKTVGLRSARGESLY